MEGSQGRGKGRGWLLPAQACVRVRQRTQNELNALFKNSAYLLAPSFGEVRSAVPCPRNSTIITTTKTKQSKASRALQSQPMRAYAAWPEVCAPTATL